MAKTNQPGLNYGENDTSAQGPVECLGLKFPNDEARRAHFTELLRKKLKDLRRIESALAVLVRDCCSMRGKLSCPLITTLQRQ